MGDQSNVVAPAEAKEASEIYIPILKRLVKLCRDYVLMVELCKEYTGKLDSEFALSTLKILKEILENQLVGLRAYPEYEGYYSNTLTPTFKLFFSAVKRATNGELADLEPKIVDLKETSLGLGRLLNLPQSQPNSPATVPLRNVRTPMRNQNRSNTNVHGHKATPQIKSISEEEISSPTVLPVAPKLTPYKFQISQSNPSTNLRRASGHAASEPSLSLPATPLPSQTNNEISTPPVETPEHSGGELSARPTLKSSTSGGSTDRRSRTSRTVRGSSVTDPRRKHTLPTGDRKPKGRTTMIDATQKAELFEKYGVSEILTMKTEMHNFMDKVDEELEERKTKIDSILKQACENGDMDKFERIVSSAAFKPEDHPYLFVYISSNNQLGMLRRILMDRRADPSIHNNIALKIAQRRNFKEIQSLLLRDERVKSSWNPE